MKFWIGGSGQMRNFRSIPKDTSCECYSHVKVYSLEYILWMPTNSLDILRSYISPPYRHLVKQVQAYESWCLNKSASFSIPHKIPKSPSTTWKQTLQAGFIFLIFYKVIKIAKQLHCILEKQPFRMLIYVILLVQSQSIYILLPIYK